MSKKNRSEKQELILKAVQLFASPKKIEYMENNKKCVMSYQEPKMEIEAYEKELRRLSLKRLRYLDVMLEVDRQHSIPDKIKRLSKKLRVIVGIYHSNGTSSDFVTSTDQRIFIIKSSVYIRVQSSGVYDNKHKMMKFCYYENNPFPITFHNDFKTLNQEGHTVPDGLLLKKTLKFEYAAQLAESKLSKGVNIAMVFAILAALIGVANFVVLLIISNKLGVV